MLKNILEARIEFVQGTITRVTLLVDFSSGSQYRDVRAIFATTKPRAGYTSVPAGAVVDTGLLVDVAAFGQETVDRDEIFPGWEKKFFNR